MFNSNSTLAHASAFGIRYVDLPREAVPVRPRGGGLRRFALVTIAAATVLIAAIGFSQQPGAAAPALKAPPVPAADPDVQWRPSLVPLQGGVSVAFPKPGLIVAPKPPGRVPTA